MAALRYASIPIVAALIGYFTHVLATQTNFRPLKYFGSPTAAALKTATPAKVAAAAAVATAHPAFRNRPPNFATLELSVIDPNRDPAGAVATPFAANSRAPIPLETAYFSGHALLLLRPDSLEVCFCLSALSAPATLCTPQHVGNTPLHAAARRCTPLHAATASAGRPALRAALRYNFSLLCQDKSARIHDQ